MKKLFLALLITYTISISAHNPSPTTQATISSGSSSEIPAPFSCEGMKKVTINAACYWQKTVTDTEWNQQKIYIYTLDGQEVGSIIYSNTYVHSFKTKYGHIAHLLINKPFRTKKLGVGRYLFNHAINHYKQKFSPHTKQFVEWYACPIDLSADDKKLSAQERMDRLVAYYESLGGKTKTTKNVSGTSMVLTIPAVTTRSKERCRYPLLD